MQSNVKRNRKKSSTANDRKKYPHITVYLKNDQEKTLIETAASKKRDSASNYIAKIVLPQAEIDAK